MDKIRLILRVRMDLDMNKPTRLSVCIIIVVVNYHIMKDIYWHYYIENKY